MPLGVKQIAKLLRNGTAGVFPDNGPGGVRGLRLVVKSRSNCNWQLRYQLDQRARYMGLGSALDVDLARARPLPDPLQRSSALIAAGK